MGRATIKENLGNGQYKVTIDRNLDVLEKEYARILEDIGDIIENRRPELEERSAALQAEINADKAQIKTTIDEFNLLLAEGDPEANVDELLAAIASKQVTINLNIASLEAEQEALKDIEDELKRTDLTAAERAAFEQAKRDSEYAIRLIIQVLADLRKEKKELQDQFNDNPVIQARLAHLVTESKKYQTALTRHLSEKSLVDRQLDDLNLKLTQHGERLDFIDALRDNEETKDVWCADLSEELKGEVGTIEVPGENVEQLVIPGFQTSGRWENAHGLLTPVACMTPASYFYNRAMLPGWQTFKPLYRFARITRLADTLADVELIEPNVSSQPAEPIDSTKINITPRSLLDSKVVEQHDLPFEYMDCDEEPFAVGDEVVVYYAERTATSGKIIGFRDNPKPCRSTTVYTTTTAGRIDSTRVKTEPEVTWALAKNLTGKVAAPAYWTGNLGSLSWVGPHHRHFWRITYNYPFGTHPAVSLDSPPGPALYHKGAIIGLAPGAIIAAAIHEESNQFIVVVADGQTHFVYASPRDGTVAWTEIGSYNNRPPGELFGFTVGGGEGGVEGKEPWFFNRAGNKACSVRYNRRYEDLFAGVDDPTPYAYLGELTIAVVPATEEVPEHLSCSFNTQLLFTTIVQEVDDVDDPCVDFGPFVPYNCTVTHTIVRHYTRPIVMAEYDKDNKLVTLGDDMYLNTVTTTTYGSEMTGGYDGCKALPDTPSGSTHSNISGGSTATGTYYYRFTGALNFYAAYRTESGSGSFTRSFCFVSEEACSVVTDGSSGLATEYEFNYLQHVNLGADEIVTVARVGVAEQSSSSTGHTVAPNRDECGPSSGDTGAGGSMVSFLVVTVGSASTAIAEENLPSVSLDSIDDTTETFFSMLIGQNGHAARSTFLSRMCVYVHPDAQHVILAEKDLPVGTGTIYLKPALGEFLDGNLEQQADLGVG